MTSGRCIFQGEFGDILIPDILTFLDMIGKTGTLQVRRGDDSKHIYWERGEIIYADSSIAAERIGDYLCLNGWIDAGPLAAARATATRDNDVVKALLRTGALEPAVLPRAFKLLVLDIVYSLFEWRTGTFAFEVTSEPSPEKIVLRTSVSNIIMEGTRRLDEWQRIREAFPSNETLVFRDPAGSEVGAKLSTVEQEVLRCIEGGRTVADIVRLVDYDQFTVLNTLLTLQGACLVTTSTSMAAAHDAAPEPAARELPEAQRLAAARIVEAFNNIFAGILERIATVKGPGGIEQFAATIQKGSFQKSDVFAGVHFGADGRLPLDTIVAHLASVPADERLPRLKGTLDRLLAQQVLQLDNSYPADEKKAVSELIAREKAQLASE